MDHLGGRSELRGLTGRCANVLDSLRGGGPIAPALSDSDTMPLPERMATLKDLVSRARRPDGASESADPTLIVTNLGDQGVEAVFGVIQRPEER